MEVLAKRLSAVKGGLRDCSKSSIILDCDTLGPRTVQALPEIAAYGFRMATTRGNARGPRLLNGPKAIFRRIDLARGVGSGGGGLKGGGGSTWLVAKRCGCHGFGLCRCGWLLTLVHMAGWWVVA